MAEGPNSVQARQTDAAGNAGAASAAFDFTLDTAAPPVPAAPDLQAASDSGASNTDNVTRVAAPRFDVAANPYFRFYRNGSKIGGDYESGGSCTTAAQNPGSYEYRLSAVDAAGNEPARSGPLAVAIDTQAPILTGYSLAEDLETPGDQITSDRTPVLSFVFSEAVHGSSSDVSAGNPLGGVNVTRHFTITASPSALAGTPGDDSFTFTAGSVWHELVVELSGRSAATYLYPASGTLNLTIDGRDGNDRITITCGAGGNFALLRKGSVEVTGPDYQVHGISVENAHVAGNGGSGQLAQLYDATGDDTFTTTPDFGTMTGKWRPAGGSADRTYYNRAENFDSYEATSTAGADLARLTDSPTSDDQLVAEPTQATMTAAGTSSRADNFRYVSADATGGNDTAQLKDSPGTDTFVATPAYGVMYASASAVNPAYLNRVAGFDFVEGVSASGGDDTARLYDSTGKDVFTFRASSNDAAMSGSGYVNQALSFRYVFAYATTGDDAASLYDSGGDDRFSGTGNAARLYDAALAAYLVEVRSFQKVDVFGSAGTNTRTTVRPIDYALTFSGPWVGDPWP